MNYTDSVSMFSTSFQKRLLDSEHPLLIRLAHKQDTYNAGEGGVFDLDIAFHLRNTGLISYLPKGRKCGIGENGKWARAGRTDMKIGRAIKMLVDKLLPHAEYSDKDIEECTNQLKAVADDSGKSDDEFVVVTGEDITRVYCGSYEIHEKTGSLYNSCMNGGDPEYFDVYARNSKTISMLLLLSAENKKELLGRALLWKGSDGETYMDRIYASDADTERMKNYARGNGWAFKKRQCYGEPYFRSKQNDYATNMTIIPPAMLVDTDFSYMPYMDTFRYVYDKGLSPTQSMVGACTYYGVADFTDGTNPRDNRIACGACGDRVSEDDVVNIDDCSYCSGCTVYSEYEGRSLVRANAVMLADGDWVRDDHPDLIRIQSRGWYLDSDTQVVHSNRDGKWYHVDDVVNDYNGEPILCRWAFEVDDDTFVHVNDLQAYCDENGYELVNGKVLKTKEKEVEHE